MEMVLMKLKEYVNSRCKQLGFSYSRSVSKIYEMYFLFICILNVTMLVFYLIIIAQNVTKQKIVLFLCLSSKTMGYAAHFTLAFIKRKKKKRVLQMLLT